MKVYILSQDGIEVFRGNNNECHIRLLQLQPQSTRWAKIWGGWTVEPLKNDDMTEFVELPVHLQLQIENSFILPVNRFGVLVDENNVPFERVAGALVGCTVRNDNFHVHGNRQNRGR